MVSADSPVDVSRWIVGYGARFARLCFRLTCRSLRPDRLDGRRQGVYCMQYCTEVGVVIVVGGKR